VALKMTLAPFILTITAGTSRTAKEQPLTTPNLETEVPIVAL